MTFCKCGHLPGQHNLQAVVAGQIEAHGACLMHNCDCVAFQHQTLTPVTKPSARDAARTLVARVRRSKSRAT